MESKNYAMTLTANAPTLDRLINMLEGVIGKLVEIDEQAYEDQIQLPVPVELDGDTEYIRGTLTHEAFEPLGLGLKLEDDTFLVEWNQEALSL